MLSNMLAFLSVLLGTHIPSTDPLVGDWLNQEPSTAGVAEILIDTNEDGHLRVHAWGKCEPNDCDWGSAKISASSGLAQAFFNAGVATTKIELVPLPDHRLLALYKSEYKDASDPSDSDHVEFFVRKTPEQDATSAEANNLLKKVAETYRSLPAGRFESEQNVEYLGRTSSMRRTNFYKTLVSGTDKSRVEETGIGESNIVISNGETVWTVFPESNEYNLAPAGKSSFAHAHTPIGPYSLLDQRREPARIIGHTRIEDSNCVIVSFGYNDKHTRTIWVDETTNLVRRDESKDISPAEGGVYSRTEVTIFSVANPLEKADPAIFSFDPTKSHARSRKDLQKAAPVSSIGTLAPEFTLKTLDGREVRLSDLRGKVVVLDFWATWCAPCRAALPRIELLHLQLKDKGAVVFGIDDEEPEDQSTFLRKFGYSIPSLVDRGNKVMNVYKVGGIPTTVIIDRDGRITAYGTDASYESLRDTLHTLAVLR
jgi:peroxiredoxin/outer membrane lipoprotein-sorting protein